MENIRSDLTCLRDDITTAPDNTVQSLKDQTKLLVSIYNSTKKIGRKAGDTDFMKQDKLEQAQRAFDNEISEALNTVRNDMAAELLCCQQEMEAAEARSVTVSYLVV